MCNLKRYFISLDTNITERKKERKKENLCDVGIMI